MRHLLHRTLEECFAPKNPNLSSSRCDFARLLRCLAFELQQPLQNRCEECRETGELRRDCCDREFPTTVPMSSKCCIISSSVLVLLWRHRQKHRPKSKRPQMSLLVPKMIWQRAGGRHMSHRKIKHHWRVYVACVCKFSTLFSKVDTQRCFCNYNHL